MNNQSLDLFWASADASAGACEGRPHFSFLPRLLTGCISVLLECTARPGPWLSFYSAITTSYSQLPPGFPHTCSYGSSATPIPHPQSTSPDWPLLSGKESQVRISGLSVVRLRRVSEGDLRVKVWGAHRRGLAH